MKKTKILLLLLLALLLFAVGCVELPSDLPSNTETNQNIESESTELPVSSTFEILFIDVGQADSALVLCDGRSMLIDGGNRGDSNVIYTVLKNNGINHLDYIVATHAHEDHIGGLAGALNYATVGTVFSPVTYYESETFENLVKYVEEQKKELTVPSVNDIFELGSAEVKILAVNTEEDTNNTSIVLKITYGETSFLFTGDAERAVEEVLVNSDSDLSSTVLKVGHHGSETSTSYLFLREVMPEYAVISVGGGNTYGHPTDEVLSRLHDADVKVFRTDLQGDIKCTSDGKTVIFSVTRNADADTLTAPDFREENTYVEPTVPEEEPVSSTYILNTSTKKFHYSDCRSVKAMSEKNKETYNGDREALVSKGYSPCGNCKP